MLCNCACQVYVAEFGSQICRCNQLSRASGSSSLLPVWCPLLVKEFWNINVALYEALIASTFIFITISVLSSYD